jgi:hypothetical protein
MEISIFVFERVSPEIVILSNVTRHNESRPSGNVDSSVAEPPSE